MSETISPKHLWREAGIAGIVLGGVSIAYSLITMIIPAGVGGVMGNLMLSILRFAIWAAKFIGCIMLVKYFMKKLVGTSFTGIFSAIPDKALCQSQNLIHAKWSFNLTLAFPNKIHAFIVHMMNGMSDIDTIISSIEADVPTPKISIDLMKH